MFLGTVLFDMCTESVSRRDTVERWCRLDLSVYAEITTVTNWEISQLWVRAFIQMTPLDFSWGYSLISILQVPRRTKGTWRIAGMMLGGCKLLVSNSRLLMIAWSSRQDTLPLAVRASTRGSSFLIRNAGAIQATSVWSPVSVPWKPLALLKGKKRINNVCS